MTDNHFLALIISGLVTLVALVIIAFIMPTIALGRDFGQWENTDPEIRAWYAGLKMPDAPDISCCGEADAYWCDTVYSRNGENFCKITDDRDNEPLMRTPIPMGTEIKIPPEKFNKDGNPTGHVIVFLRYFDPGNYTVYCFILNGGV